MVDPMARYKARRQKEHVDPIKKYQILGYIAAGTYGRVYKAQNEGRLVAIKKFKADKEIEPTYYTGISQSAIREIALSRDLNHENIVRLLESVLEDKSIYLVLEYAEHDLLQLIQYHCQNEPRKLPDNLVRSVLGQVLSGVAYLHRNWVLHRDLKPANIMITAGGRVKIGDLGLARIFRDPLQSLYSGDRVVVTIWYRAPELLLGCRHYTPTMDIWAVGCIMGEMLALKPMFKGEEARMDNRKRMPFQRGQMQKLLEILGTPSTNTWRSITACPEYHELQSMRIYPNRLEQWYRTVNNNKNPAELDILRQMLIYNPDKRISAEDALKQPFFQNVSMDNCFEGVHIRYPTRRITSATNMSIPASNRRPVASADGNSRKKIKAA